MSPTVPVGDPASRPEKVATFVSRSDPRATAVVDELNAFSSERSLSTETRVARKSLGRHRSSSDLRAQHVTLAADRFGGGWSGCVDCQRHLLWSLAVQPLGIRAVRR